MLIGDTNNNNDDDADKKSELWEKQNTQICGERESGRSDDDVIDGDEDELDEESNESHHHESYRCTHRNLGKFYTTRQQRKEVGESLSKQ